MYLVGRFKNEFNECEQFKYVLNGGACADSIGYYQDILMSLKDHGWLYDYYNRDMCDHNLPVMEDRDEFLQLLRDLFQEPLLTKRAV